ncbi:MAG: phosphotransferase [Candidatus ainarchaeum sp.]|nr:phosphotransferase [Candidatus ainarchaeum sp.]
MPIKRKRKKIIVSKLGPLSVNHNFKNTHYNHVYSSHLNAQDIIIKLKKRSAPNFPTTSEAAALRLLNRRGLGPKFIGIDFKKSILIREKIKGRIPKKKSNRAIMLIAEEFSRIHQIKLSKFGRPFNRQRGNIQDFFKSEKKFLFNFINKLEPNNIETIKLLRFFIQLDKETKLIFNGKNISFSLLNLDLNINNVVIKNKQAHFFDWNTAKAGDPAMDIARFFTLNQLTKTEQTLFYKKYFKENPDLEFIKRVNIYLPFFNIGQAAEAIFYITYLKKRHQKQFNNQSIADFKQVKEYSFKELNLT